jgi:hypothetical protein
MTLVQTEPVTKEMTWPDRYAEELAKKLRDITVEEVVFHHTAANLAYHLQVLSEEVLRLGGALVRERDAWRRESLKDASARSTTILKLA